MKKIYKFTAKVNDENPYHPKGFYYQGKYIILVGDVDENHTIRRKELIKNVDIKIKESTA